MFSFPTSFHPATKPSPTTTSTNTVARPPAQITVTAQNLTRMTHFSDGMVSDRLAQAKANAYKLGICGGAVMNWVDPPGSGPVWPRGPLTPDGGKAKQPGVDVMQGKLIDLGYLDGKVITDTTRGLYGPKTEAAVKTFQFANGLPVTGVADEATLALMGGPSALTMAQALAGSRTNPVIGASIGTAGPSPVPTVDTLQLPPRTGTVQVNGAANLRGGPGKDNAVTNSVPNGTQLSIVGEQGDWRHVTYPGKDGQRVDGWIFKDLVKEPPRQDPRVASRMESLGYVHKDGQVDEMAIKNFQAMNGLEETGTLNDATLAAMWSPDARVNNHLTQLKNKVWNPEATGSNNNCGPASVAMALASAGLITIDPSNPEAAIDAARKLAGGTAADKTGPGDLRDAITGQHGETYDISNLDQVQIAISRGDPVVLFGYEQKNTSYRGAHWVAVVGYDKATDSFLVQDPLAAGGVQHWSRDDMKAYADFSIPSVAAPNPNG